MARDSDGKQHCPETGADNCPVEGGDGKKERSEILPHISLVAADHLDGPITIEVPVLNNNFNYWYVGIGIKYNISSLFKNNHRIKQARLNVRRAQEQYRLAQEYVENAVQEGFVNFMTAFTDLQTQRNSVRLANENYSVTDNRYKNEMALLTDMLDASNMKLSADLGGRCIALQYDCPAYHISALVVAGLLYRGDL